MLSIWIEGQAYCYNREAQDYIIDLYINKHKGSINIVKELEEKYNLKVSTHCIYKILHENNIQLRDDKQQAQKYYCNDDYFQIIDSSEKAYWLGFLYSDGFIQNKRKHNNYKIGITLSNIDREHLEKFKKCIEFTGPVKTYTPIKTSYNTKPYSKIIVSSNKMAEDLINKGCLLNKTNKLIYPNEQILDRKFEKDFIRGLIDGDGSLIITNLNNDKHKSFELSFTGTKDICLGILKYFNKNLKLIQRHPERNNDNFSFTIGGNKQVINIVEDLYEDASIYLDRKYEKYLKMLEISREQQ